MSRYVVSYVVMGFGVPNEVCATVVEADSIALVHSNLKDILVYSGVDEDDADMIIKYGAYTITNCDKAELRYSNETL